MKLWDGINIGNQFTVLLCCGTASQKSGDLFHDVVTKEFSFWICLLLHSFMNITVSSFFRNTEERTRRTLVLCSSVCV